MMCEYGFHQNSVYIYIYRRTYILKNIMMQVGRTCLHIYSVFYL